MRWPSRPRRLRSGMNKFAATRVSSGCWRVAVSISKFGSRSYAPDSDQLSRAYRISTNHELRLRLSLCFQQSLALNGSEGEVMVNKVSASKFLSLLLRHKPEEVGLVLDPDGWAEIDQIVERTSSGKIPLTRSLIEELTRTSEKQRFKISEDGTKIRANQGHSVKVELGLVAAVPPEVLYHGTATRFLESILAEGLKSGNRNHVHLSRDSETAVRVGQRHGKPVVLEVLSGTMHREGASFFLSENGVWLTESVQAKFLALLVQS